MCGQMPGVAFSSPLESAPGKTFRPRSDWEPRHSGHPRDTCPLLLALTILCYSTFTFLGAVATSVWQLAAFRQLEGVGIGNEWSQQQFVGEREDGAVGADAEGEHENCHDGESGPPGLLRLAFPFGQSAIPAWMSQSSSESFTIRTYP